MGTTAEKIQRAIDAKEAIRAKFNLPANLPFWQYADSIELPESGGGDIATDDIAEVVADLRLITGEFAG